jgi:hypothetical protein
MRRFDGTSLVLCNERTAAVSLGKNEVAFRISASRHHASKRKHHDSRQCQLHPRETRQPRNRHFHATQGHQTNPLGQFRRASPDSIDNISESRTFLERKRKEAGFVLKWQDAFETICPFDL